MKPFKPIGICMDTTAAQPYLYQLIRLGKHTDSKSYFAVIDSLAIDPSQR